MNLSNETFFLKRTAMVLTLFSFFGLSLFGCSGDKRPSIPLTPEVELSRYMGDWYVIAAIPTFIETTAFNAIESYKLDPDGTIATTFTFNDGALDGPKKEHHPRGFVVENTGNALWGMQFIWPIKGEFRIAYLDPEYLYTIIARNRRDYVWIMARSPNISEERYQELVQATAAMGYDISTLRRVPHSK